MTEETKDYVFVLPEGALLGVDGRVSGGGGPGRGQGEIPQAAALNGDPDQWRKADPAQLAAIGADAEGLAHEAQKAFCSAEKREPRIVPECFRGGKYPDAVLDPASILHDEHLRWQYAQALSLLRHLNRPIYLFGAMAADRGYQSQFAYWQREMMAAGFRVLNPARQPEGFSNAFYMHQAMNDIDQCDVLLAVPSPFLHESKGIWVEIAYAEYTSKYVLWNGDALLGLNRS